LLTVGQPDRFAAIVASSDEGQWLNGQFIAVEGGSIMR
jgi:hypothetical protein